MRLNKGFTLIELMIVIAIIAIIAAIAIPGILTAIRASNERNASISLKQVLNAQPMFRSGGGLGSYYWVGDLAALNWGKVPGATTLSAYIADDSMAKADDAPKANGTNFDWDGDGFNDYTIAGTPPGTPLPKSSYLFGKLTTDETGAAYVSVAGGGNTGKYGFYARPSNYPSSGRYQYHLNEGGNVSQKDTGNNLIVLQYQGGGGWSPVQ